MPDTPAFDIDFETKESILMIESLLSKVEKPKALLNTIERWLNFSTRKMFFGVRPDTRGVRGKKWPRLAEQTIQRKKAKVKAGKAVYAFRPLVETGRMRDDIRVKQRDSNGFTFGTNVKSKKGFNYPAYHNANKFPWLFITKKEYGNISRMITDFLNDKLKNPKSYMVK